MTRLDRLLASWRASRDPRLGAQITTAGRLDARDVTAPLAKLKPQPLADALLAAFAALDPEATTPLLAVVDRFVRTARGSWPVIEILAELPGDPRVAPIAIGLLRDFSELKHSSAKLWRRLLDVVEQHGDASHVPDLRMVQPAHDPATARRRMDNVATKIARHTALDDAELAALVAEIAAAPTIRVATPVSSGEALLAAVHADPDDDDARAVYADWLTAQDDPRGEFIVLQLQRAAGTLTEARGKRETALLRKHFRAWLGPFGTVIGPNRWGTSPDLDAGELAIPVNGFGYSAFARGFPSRLQQLDVPKHRASLYDDAAWATIEHVESLHAITPVMRSLRSIGRCPIALVADGRAFDGVGIDYPSQLDEETLPACRVGRLTLRVSSGSELATTLVARMRAAVASPALREIWLAGTAFFWLRDAWVWRGVLDAPPLARFGLELGTYDRLWLQKTAAGWTELVASIDAGYHTESWRSALGDFQRRPVATLEIRAADPGAGQALTAVAREMRVAADIRITPS